MNLANVPDGTYSGSSQNVESRGHFYGTLGASVTVSGGKITAITFNQSPTARNERFISAVQSVLVPEIIRTQNVRVGIVTGATGTSVALIYSIENALSKA